MPVGSYHIQYGNHYPLVDPAPEHQGFLVDLSISYENSAWEYSLPLHLKKLNNGSIKIASNTGVIFFSSNSPSHTELLDNNTLTLYQWDGGSIQVKAVINNQIQCPENEFDEPIDIRATFCVPPRVRRVRIFDENKVTSNWFTNHIQLVAGHNIQLKSNERGEFRSPNEIKIAAIAGAGTGTVSSDCETENIAYSLKSINDIPPDEFGTVFLKGVDGYTISLDCPGTSDGSTINISNTNTPCCKCSDMYNLARYIKLVADQYMEIGGKAIWLRNKHNELVSKWTNMAVASHANAVNVQITKDVCPMFHARVSVSNITPFCMKNIQGSISVTASTDFIFKTARISQNTGGSGTGIGFATKYSRNSNNQSCATTRMTTGSTSKQNIVYVETGESVAWSKLLPGETGHWVGDYQILPDEDGKYPSSVMLKIVLDSLNAQYEATVENTGFGETFTASVGSATVNPQVLCGSRMAESIMTCQDRNLVDPAADDGWAEEIRSNIFRLKKKYWPCPGSGSESESEE